MKHQIDSSILLNPLPAITLHEFNELSKEQQTELLWDKGFVLGDRSDEKHLYVLYNIFTFYVEVKYFSKSIIDISTFKNNRQLRFYRVIPAILTSNKFKSIPN